MTNWTPEVHVVGVRCLHVYLVPDNGSIARLQTVGWGDAPDLNPAPGIAMALKQLFHQVDVPEPDDVHDLAASLWARLDRRTRPAPPA